MLRDTAILKGPRPIDRSKSETMSTPDGWRTYGAPTSDAFFSLVTHERDQRNVGYCAYDWNLTDSPECEILLGGYNAKMPDAAGIWRQGNVLSFAFDIEPSDLSDNGRNVLINSIAYIARFGDDRPITMRPEKPIRLRCIWERYPSKPTTVVGLNSWFGPTALKEMDRDSESTMMAWWAAHRSTLYPVNGWKFDFLTTADGKRIAYDQPAFFDRMLASGDTTTLSRFVAGGPGDDADVDAWRRWVASNRDYVFFSDVGGYRWYVDPLAKRRGVPTSKLRGEARASRPAFPARRRL